jgi:hypothetical protein
VVFAHLEKTGNGIKDMRGRRRCRSSAHGVPMIPAADGDHRQPCQPSTTASAMARTACCSFGVMRTQKSIMRQSE